MVFFQENETMILFPSDEGWPLGRGATLIMISPRWGYYDIAPLGLLGYCTPSEAEGWGYYDVAPLGLLFVERSRDEMLGINPFTSAPLGEHSGTLIHYSSCEADACSPSGAEEKISSISAFFAEIICICGD